MRRTHRTWLRGVAALSAFLAFAWSSFAGVTGKIGGKVLDEQTGEPLIGANVLIKGTQMGAAAGMDGSYLIINVPPGKYTLRVTMIGYETANITDVQVFTDRTTRIDVKLRPSVVKGKEVTIVAERERIEFDRTSTAAYISEDEIEKLPVASLHEIIQMQAGVVADAGGALHFRGGRSREVAYMIDGVPVSNTFSQGGGSNVAIENNFVKEIQVITGTFNAEYGSAQSGVVNVVTKVPERSYHATIEGLTGGYYSPNSPMFIGLDRYDPLTEKELKFSLTGPIPFPQKLGKLGFFFNGRLLDSGGWLNGERRYRPEDGWEIVVYREWYKAIYDPIDPLVIPLPDSLHTGDGKIVHMNWNKSASLNFKMVYQPKPTFTLSYNVFGSRSHGKSYRPTWRFCPDGIPQHRGNSLTHILTITHAVGRNVFYNLRYSHQSNHSRFYTYESADDPRYQITAVNAWDPGKITGYDMGGIDSWDRRWFDQSIDLVNGDITWQMNKYIELKTGFEAKFYNFHYRNAPMREMFGYEQVQFPFTRKEIEEFDFPWEFFRDTTYAYEYGHIRLRESNPDSLRDQQFYVDYNRSPRDGAAYAQTKLELGEVVVNAGVRLDAYWPRDVYAPSYDNVYPEMVGYRGYYVWAKPKWQLSPRFGLSFPISDRGAMRLSYGHFFQAPSYEKMYQNPVLPWYNSYSIAETRIGNPNLKPERTVQYEIGLQQALTDDIAMELTVFYKDVRDLLGIELLTLSDATTFYRYVNKEFGNSKGFTLAFNQGFAGGMISSSIDYTYMIAKGSASSAEVLRDIQIVAGPGTGAYNVAVRRINYLDWDQRHTLNASVTIRPSQTLTLGVIAQLGSGLPYTPATLDPSIQLPGGEWDNAGRKPTRWNVDFRMSKTFKVAGLDLAAIVRVFNVFNHLNENRVHPITGRAGPNAYLPEVARRRYWRLEQLGEFTRDEADYDPTYYSRPRLIQFGLQLSM